MRKANEADRWRSLHVCHDTQANQPYPSYGASASNVVAVEKRRRRGWIGRVRADVDLENLP